MPGLLEPVAQSMDTLQSVGAPHHVASAQGVLVATLPDRARLGPAKNVRIGRTLLYTASGAGSLRKHRCGRTKGAWIMGSTDVAVDRRSEAAGARLESATVPLRLLRFGEVRRRTGLSRSTIWRMERSGVFPRRIKISINVVAWREDEVDKWIASKICRP